MDAQGDELPWDLGSAAPVIGATSLAVFAVLAGILRWRMRREWRDAPVARRTSCTS
jgi:hypothetical protein